MSILELLLKGGWLMVPLILLSILTLYGLFERILTLHTKTSLSAKWLARFYQRIQTSDWKGAQELCEEGKNHPLVKIFQAGLTNLPGAPQQVAPTIEITAQEEVYQLEKNLSLLASIASIAPMLGFLGTVVGMIEAFMDMSQAKTGITPQLLANGIYQAMITTAAGLVIGILADVSYKYLVTRVEKIAYNLQKEAQTFIAFLPKK